MYMYSLTHFSKIGHDKITGQIVLKRLSKFLFTHHILLLQIISSSINKPQRDI